MLPNPKPAIFTYANFNLQALCKQASQLRQGLSCTCNPDQRPASGSFNWAVFISFEDGVLWVFKSPHAREFMPKEMGMKLLLHSDIPVSEVYEVRFKIKMAHATWHSFLMLHSDTFENDISVPYILMSEAPGKPLAKYWKSAPSSTSLPGDLDIQPQAKSRILSQLGAITSELSQLRFDKIGSLFRNGEGTGYRIEECLYRGLLLDDRYALDDIPCGPFHLTLAMSHHCFEAPVPSPDDYDSHDQYIGAVDLWNDFVSVGCKTDSASNRLDYKILEDALQQSGILASLQVQYPATKLGFYPLSHGDLSVNNIYVDDDFNITCIIDWALTSTVTESVLPSSPGLPQFGDRVSSEVYASFIDGFMAAIPKAEALSGEEADNHRETLARGQRSWSLTRLLNLDSTDDYTLFSSIWDFTATTTEDHQRYILRQRKMPYYTASIA
ncbi:hypothetical protein BDW69DRAFT_200215 [Aspergillus filifer]